MLSKKLLQNEIDSVKSRIKSFELKFNFSQPEARATEAKLIELRSYEAKLLQMMKGYS